MDGCGRTVGLAGGRATQEVPGVRFSGELRLGLDGRYLFAIFVPTAPYTRRLNTHRGGGFISSWRWRGSDLRSFPFHGFLHLSAALGCQKSLLVEQDVPIADHHRAYPSIALVVIPVLVGFIFGDDP